MSSVDILTSLNNDCDCAQKLPHVRVQYLGSSVYASSNKEIVLSIIRLLVEIAEQWAVSIERYRCRGMRTSDDTT